MWTLTSSRTMRLALGVLILFMALPLLFLIPILSSGATDLGILWSLFSLLLPVIVVFLVVYVIFTYYSRDRLDHYVKTIPRAPEQVLVGIQTTLASLGIPYQIVHRGVPFTQYGYTYLERFILPREGLSIWVRLPRIPFSGISFFGAEVGIGLVSIANAMVVQQIIGRLDQQVGQGLPP